MSISIDALRAMAALGATTEMLLAAIEVEQAKDEADLAARRRRAADKKARQRARLKGDVVDASDATQDEEKSPLVPGTEGDRGGQEGTSVVKEGPQTPKENYTQEVKNTGVRERRPKRAKPVGELCPENLQPNESHRAKCREAGMPETFADMCCKRLISWSHENTHREIAYKTDWSRALHGMLDKEIEKARVGGNFSSGSKTPSRPERGSPATLLEKRLEARLVRHQAPRPSPREPGSAGPYDLAPDASDEGPGPARRSFWEPTGAAPDRSTAQGNLRAFRALTG